MGRLLFAIMTGNLFGATCAGVVGDLVGWRGVFFATGMLGAAVLRGIRLPASAATKRRPGGFDLSTLVPNYRAIFRNPLAKICFGAVFLEAVFMYGVFPYIATMLHEAGETRASIAGIVIGGFGVGGALYAVSVSRLLRPSRRDLDDAHRRNGHGALSRGNRRACAVAGRVRQFRFARLRLLHAARGHPDLRQRTGARRARLGAWRCIRFSSFSGRRWVRRSTAPVSPASASTRCCCSAPAFLFVRGSDLRAVAAAPGRDQARRLAAAAIGRDALVRHPDAGRQFALLPEHVDRHAAARIPVAADAQPFRLEQRERAVLPMATVQSSWKVPWLRKLAR